VEITLPITDLIILVIGALGVSLSIASGVILLIHKKTNERSNYILAILLIASGLTLLNDVIGTSGISSRFKNLYFTPLNYSLSIGPLFYLFVKSKFSRNLSTVDYLHLLLPFIQFMAYAFIGFRSVAYKAKLWGNMTFRSILDVEDILFVFGIVFYSLLSFYLVKRPSSTDYFWSKDLGLWLNRMVRVFIVIASSELVFLLGDYFLSDGFPDLFYLLRILLFVLLIALIVYNTIKLLFPGSIYQSLPLKKPVSIDEAESNQILSRLTTLMEEQEIYLNPDLSLSILSKYLGISDKSCSLFFSSALDTNFNKYINKYRVDAFKEKVRSGKYESLTLLGIAFDSGFDSKSTFYRVFKQMEGVSPSAYKKSVSNPAE